MKKKTQTLVAGLLMATMFLAPVAAIAQDKPEKSKTPAAGGAPDKSAPATRVLPFNGNVAAVDKDAKTVTVGKQVLHVSDETKLTKGNQSVTVADIAVGDAIAGSYTKGDDGKLTAKMMRVGPKPDSAQAEKKSSGKKKDEGTNSRQ